MTHSNTNPQSVYIGLLILSHGDVTYKTETAVHGCHYLLGDVAVRMPDRELLFECVTCFYCSKDVRLCQMCANSRKKKNRMTRPWVAESLHDPSLTKGSKTDDPPPLCSGPPTQYFLTSPLRRFFSGFLLKRFKKHRFCDC